MAVRTVHVMISGRVQGVGYRAWAADEATARGLSGWVRNRRDGGVEAIFSGEVTDVAAMLEACGAGPRIARVDAMEVENIASPETGAFRVLPTA